jgi:hypothetical protein
MRGIADKYHTDHQCSEEILGPDSMESVGIRHDVQCWHEQGHEVQFFTL